MTDINEDLRKWFKEKWVRFDTKGNIKGDCAKEPGEGKPKCLPMAKAHALGKEKRASAARRKRKQDPHAERKGKAKFVKTHNEEVLLEKNVPTNPKLWAQAKAQAKKKFKIYPSAYANGWAAKWYKSKGGGWKSLNEDYEYEMARNELRTAMRGIERLMKHLDGEGDLEAWVQSKLTKAADYIDTLADYMDSRDSTVKEAYELIGEAKKKMDKKIPQTIQNMTSGSNPYADDSNCPTYVATPGQAITEARRSRESLKAKYKKETMVGGSKYGKPGVRKRRQELRDLATQRAAAAAKRKELARQSKEKRQKELYPGPKKSGTPTKPSKAPAKQMVPPMKGEKTPSERIAAAFNRPEYKPKPEETKKEIEPTSPFWKYIKYIKKSGEPYDPKKGKALIKQEYKETRANIPKSDQFAFLKRHSAEESYIKQMEHHGNLTNSILHRILKSIGLREEHGAGDTGTTELTNKYIEHTPGQLPLGTTKVKKEKKLSDTIKEVVAEQVLTERVKGVGTPTGHTVTKPKSGSPAGRFRNTNGKLRRTTTVGRTASRVKPPKPLRPREKPLAARKASISGMRRAQITGMKSRQRQIASRILSNRQLRARLR